MGCRPRREQTMKYMILVYASQQDYDGMAGKAGDYPAWSAEEFAALGAFMESFNAELAKSGELVETRGLAAPVHTRRVQLQNGVPVVTDGPYAEAQEVLAGYWVVECDSFDRATELAASLQWPTQGVPDSPRGWLIRVASRRLTDLLRGEQARRRREDTVATWVLPEQWLAPAADRQASETDDTLILLFMCCHPSLSPASQIALTLRAVGGLTTSEIARAFLVPEATMTRRISRAKQRIKDSGIPFGMPLASERTERLGAVLHVLYLIFNEGFATTSGPSLQRT